MKDATGEIPFTKDTAPFISNERIILWKLCNVKIKCIKSAENCLSKGPLMVFRHKIGQEDNILEVWL